MQEIHENEAAALSNITSKSCDLHSVSCSEKKNKKKLNQMGVFARVLTCQTHTERA